MSEWFLFVAGGVSMLTAGALTALGYSLRRSRP